MGRYLLQPLQIRLIKRPRHLTGHQPLHEERHAEDIHPVIPQRLDGRGVGPGVVFVEFAGDVGFAEFGAGFADAEPLVLLLAVYILGGYWSRGWVGCSTGESRRALFDIPRVHQARCGGCYEEVDEFHGV